MYKKAVLFDFDGVTVKSMEQHFEAWSRAFAEKNIVLKRDEFLIQEGQGISTISTVLGKKYGLQDTEIEEVARKKVAYYNTHKRFETYPGSRELFERLSAHKIPMGVVTGGGKARVAPVIENYFPGIFDCLVTVDDTEKGKPYPDPYLKGAQLLKNEPADCIVVENAPLGIKAAERAGMYVIAVETTLDGRFLESADEIVADFAELRELLDLLLGIQG